VLTIRGYLDGRFPLCTRPLISALGDTNILIAGGISDDKFFRSEMLNLIQDGTTGMMSLNLVSNEGRRSQNISDISFVANGNQSAKVGKGAVIALFCD